MGIVLLALGTYSTAFVVLLLDSVVVRPIDVDVYESLCRVVGPYMPRLIWSLVFAECAGVLLVIAGLTRPSWQVWRNALWRAGILQILLVGLLVCLKALAWLLFALPA